MPLLVLTLLGVSLAYGAFAQAGVTLEWNWTLCGIGLAATLHFLIETKNHTRASALPRTVLVCLFAIPSLAALSVIPLPTGLIGVLSNYRLDLVHQTAGVLGVPEPSSTTLSIAPLLTLQYVLTLTGLVLVFLIVRDTACDLRRDKWSWAPVWPILVVASLEAALGFYQAYVVDDINGGGFARGTYSNRDHFAGLLELVFPYALLYPFAILGRNKDRNSAPAMPAIRACALFGMAALILIAVILSLSRMAFLSVLASTFIAGALAFGLSGVENAGPTLVNSRRAIPIAAVAIAVVLGFIYLPTDPLIARFSDLAKTEDISADTRVQLWRDTWSVIHAFPVFGSGVGTYESALYRFKTVAPMNTADYAHNDYLQVLAEMGFVGFAAGAIVVIFVMIAALRGAYYARDSDERFFNIAAISSLAAILLHSLVDFNLYVPANSMVMAWVGGMAATRLGRETKRRSRS